GQHEGPRAPPRRQLSHGQGPLRRSPRSTWTGAHGQVQQRRPTHRHPLRPRRGRHRHRRGPPPPDVVPASLTRNPRHGWSDCTPSPKPALLSHPVYILHDMRTRRSVLALCVSTLLVLAACAGRRVATTNSSAASGPGAAIVDRVVDGDTIIVRLAARR